MVQALCTPVTTQRDLHAMGLGVPAPSSSHQGDMWGPSAWELHSPGGDYRLVWMLWPPPISYRTL